MIASGRVTVDGEVVRDPARDVGEGDDVRVDGSPVGAEAREVWAVNKPAGVVSTARVFPIDPTGVPFRSARSNGRIPIQASSL